MRRQKEKSVEKLSERLGMFGQAAPQAPAAPQAQVPAPAAPQNPPPAAGYNG